MKTKYLGVLVMCLLLTLGGYAQDKAKDKPAEKAEATPESIELTKEQTARINALQTQVEMSSLRADNLQLRIKEAQAQLEKLQKATNDAERAVTAEIVAMTKLAAVQLQEYSAEEKDGKLIFRKRKKE